MGWKVNRLNQKLRQYDRNLIAKESDNGMIQVWRLADKWSSADLCSDDFGSSRPMQFIFALTDNWTVTGKPVDLGIEPVMDRVREMDLWSKVSFLDEMRKNRDRVKAIKEQTKRNEIQAMAYDMRKDFAKATNEINTSTLEKVESRRTKYGNS